MAALAGQLQTVIPERSLQRAIVLGTVRGYRPGPRRFTPAPGEVNYNYLEGHWELLSQLREVLGAQPLVRLAVLYGSFARGDDVLESDIDLLVRFSEPITWRALADLTIKVGKHVNREADIADLDRVVREAPLLALQAIDGGRVLVDKDATWRELRADRTAIYARAQRAYQKAHVSLSAHGFTSSAR